MHNPDGRPGGWGFSDINTINPDVDDTSYSLRALCDLANSQPNTYRLSWQAGLDWILSMQNDDGGWPAFEKTPISSGSTTCPSRTPNPSGPTLLQPTLPGGRWNFWDASPGMVRGDEKIERAVNWLLKNQKPDGSWYGRWGIAYIYGTWAAITGLIAVGVEPGHPAVQKAVQWLLSIQNADGGSPLMRPLRNPVNPIIGHDRKGELLSLDFLQLHFYGNGQAGRSGSQVVQFDINAHGLLIRPVNVGVNSLNKSFATVVRDLPVFKQRKLEFISLNHYFEPGYITVVIRKDKVLTSYKSIFLNILLGQSVIR